VLRHLRAILLLPFLVTVVIPAIILAQGQWPPRLAPWPLVLLALVLLAAGLALMARTISLFARVGRGTLAPWDPTRRLVVEGIYRHVRNPMISGVFCLLLAEALLFRSWPLLGWLLIAVLINALYIPLVEERGLERRFGVDYLAYKAHVPRWLPRRTPWQPAGEEPTAAGESAPGARPSAPAGRG
jgi:protein-S-isoprenylcysteine O-methyltransferase Ste14